MGKSISRGVRLPEEYIEVLDYLAETEQGGDSFNGVVRSSLEEQIDFRRLLPKARSFFSRRDRLIEQEKRSINHTEQEAEATVDG